MAATRSGHIMPTIDEGMVRERPVVLGPDGNLVGVLARPGTAPAAAPAAPPVIFLNAGVLHRIGPHRLHVTLARRLAACGIASLRLDLSGIGDSRPVPGSLSFRDSSVADTRAAMDQLAGELGSDRFVLFGLCSGADNALAAAVADPRVCAVVVLDPPAYVTPRARLRKLVARARALGSAGAVATWGAGAVMRRVRRRLAAARGGAEGEGHISEVSGGREVPPPALTRAQLTTLADRGVAVLAIFSGALGDRYNHPDQLFELFPELRGRIDRRYFPRANHTFTELAVQAELVSTVTGWSQRLAGSGR